MVVATPAECIITEFRSLAGRESTVHICHMISFGSIDLESLLKASCEGSPPKVPAQQGLTPLGK
jgi:hypothetical protein